MVGCTRCLVVKGEGREYRMGRLIAVLTACGFELGWESLWWV